MEINWFTFIAQIINFATVLYVLKRVLYGPIIAAMDERKAELASRFAEAESLAESSREEAESYEAARAELDASRDQLMAEAAEEASVRRSEMIRDARTEVEELQSRWFAGVRREKQRFLEDVRVRMGESVYLVARDALSDLADAELEQEIVSTFLDRIQTVEEDDRPWSGLAGAADDVIVVRSAFELPHDVQERIRTALAEVKSDHDNGEHGETPAVKRNASIAFSQSPDLICGIEVQLASRRVAWDVRDYLDTYAEQLDAAILSEMESHGMLAREETIAADGILPG